MNGTRPTHPAPDDQAHIGRPAPVTSCTTYPPHLAQHKTKTAQRTRNKGMHACGSSTRSGNDQSSHRPTWAAGRHGAGCPGCAWPVPAPCLPLRRGAPACSVRPHPPHAGRFGRQALGLVHACGRRPILTQHTARRGGRAAPKTPLHPTRMHVHMPQHRGGTVGSWMVLEERPQCMTYVKSSLACTRCPARVAARTSMC